ncbi:sialin-like [Haliotis rufescens]|uniref:sialin-like n=1 Tax=Haliotis rufescens TaxID=6454 RepID=UPI00201E90EB|nr:sialin-like [Haliotis rufescens]
MAADLVEERKCCRCAIPRRWTLAIMGFGAMFWVSAMRDQLSIAIVCMVNGDVGSSPWLNTTSSSSNSTFPHETEAVSKESSGFPWDKTEQSLILAMFFAGICSSTVLGIWYLKHDVIRYYMGGGLMVCAVATIIIPHSLTLELRLIYALRLITGMGAATMFPGLQSMWGKWAPRNELARLSTISASGRFLGTVLAFSLTGVLCNVMEDGWKLSFYISGAGGLIWFVLWQLLTANNPATDPRISSRERDYIVSNIDISYKENVATPWRAILTSKPVIGCLVIHMVSDWVDYSLTTSGPTYMHEVLHVNIYENGLLSSVPHLARGLSTVLVGMLADLLVKRKVLSIKWTRIIFQTLSNVGSAVFLVWLGFVSADQRSLAVFLFTAVLCMQAFAESAYQVNEVEIAPRYAGVITSMGNSLSAVAGVLAPIITGAMTPNKSQEEWRNSFMVIVGLCVVSLVVYLAFLKVTVQPWAREKQKKPSVAHVVQFGTEPDETKQDQ